ncbi:MAG: hypothetical protein HKP61_20535 [Dactylosporangium sp.]|nr:chitinase [Dactylosporangium sp.]NNJ63270.1 hypothetical protein [Dactylosporangium sp.]
MRSRRTAGILARVVLAGAWVLAAVPGGCSGSDDTGDVLLPGGRPVPTPDSPVPSAAPYLHLGWGSPPDPIAVMAATGIRAFTLAFVLSSGDCTPAWDGARPLTGGGDERTIAAIREAGGDVVVSFGGWSGRKLGEDCASAADLARAYQRVIDAYRLRAIDVDLERTEFSDPVVQDRVMAALRQIKRNNPAVQIIVTMGTEPAGPGAAGARLVRRAAALGMPVDVWTIMPFDVGGPQTAGSMGALSARASTGLHEALRAACPALSDAQVYRMQGISSMNGRTDHGEVVTPTDLREILAHARAHRLARLTFWSVNRDRACGGGGAGDACSGIAQATWEFTRIIAAYPG